MKDNGWAIACFFVLLATQSIGAAEIRAVYRTDLDSNPHKLAGGGQGALVSRFLLTASGVPIHHRRGVLILEQQSGVKRFWTASALGQDAGDVFINQWAVRGHFWVSDDFKTFAGARFKYKQATRAPGEESYLNGFFHVGLSARANTFLTGRVFFQAGADDSRDLNLPETTFAEFGAVLMYARHRHLTGNMHVGYRGTTFDRFALSNTINMGIEEMGDRQYDRLLTMRFDVQAAYRAVIKLSYMYLKNRSNSYGYPFVAQQVEGVLAIASGIGVDIQCFTKLQLRSYDETLPDEVFLPVDEHVQAIAVLKLSRQLSRRYGISGQVEWSRNGARRGNAFYRKRVFSVSMESVL